jgi:hypothetical protein
MMKNVIIDIGVNNSNTINVLIGTKKLIFKREQLFPYSINDTASLLVHALLHKQYRLMPDGVEFALSSVVQYMYSIDY